MSSETHNKLAADYVQMAGRNAADKDELMVIVESTMLASMHLLVRLHGVTPGDASVYMEAALQAATERFAEAAADER